MASLKGKHGGFRVGSGRKPKAEAGKWLSGTKARPGRGPRPVSAAPVVVGPVPIPASVTAEAVEVWAELAPHAIAEGKLTARTAEAFGILCRLIVAERLMAVSEIALGGNHRGTLQRIEAGMARFRLTGDGRPVEVVTVEDEWTQFDVVQGGKR